MSIFKLQADEFAIVDISERAFEEFEDLALLILNHLADNSFHIDQNKVFISATIGITKGGERPLTNADVALRLAKKLKKEYLIYESSMLIEEAYEQNINKLKELKNAIAEKRIITLYQPIINTKTKKIEKYESLVRLKEKDGTLTSPFYFLEFSKRAKIYPFITKIVAEQAFEKFKDKPYEFSINLCVEDILNSKLTDFLKNKIKEYNIARRVVFELVESEGIENFDEVIKFIEEFKALGCKIAIDDFGTGYSNFEYLMKLKVDFLKIDASMIKNIDTDENSQKITQTINNFAKDLGIKTIGEFVYSESIYKKAKEFNIDYCQGYYFGKPTDVIE